MQGLCGGVQVALRPVQFGAQSLLATGRAGLGLGRAGDQGADTGQLGVQAAGAGFSRFCGSAGSHQRRVQGGQIGGRLVGGAGG